MQFHETHLPGLLIVEADRIGDDRGFFARLYCQREFATQGIAVDFVQINNSFSQRAGTLRGLHYQVPPHAEAKLVRCVRGSVWDCAIDLRTDSPTFGQWHGCTLSAEDRRMVFIPAGMAHGFLTLGPESEVIYMADEFHSPEHERGIRWDDPRFAIDWPLEPTSVSAKDRSFPDFGD